MAAGEEKVFEGEPWSEFKLDAHSIFFFLIYILALREFMTSYVTHKTQNLIYAEDLGPKNLVKRRKQWSC